MSSDLIKKILLFLFVNFLGFSSPTLVFILSSKFGIFADKDPAALSAIQEQLFGGTNMTWLVCAFFSFAYFVFDGFWGRFFLWSAFTVPLLYGLSVMSSMG
ncbi:MAG: hypothetical protein KDJ35_08215 [Alphaproteobacteria bacterium]|nr:hypothetical protein [Alphaproteobacteria bacterium]